MKPLFVSSRDGVRRIHWTRLFVFSVALLLVAAGVAEGLSYLFKGTFSVGGLVVAETLAILLLARIVVRSVSYQPLEYEEAESS